MSRPRKRKRRVIDSDSEGEESSSHGVVQQSSAPDLHLSFGMEMECIFIYHNDISDNGHFDGFKVASRLLESLDLPLSPNRRSTLARTTVRFSDWKLVNDMSLLHFIENEKLQEALEIQYRSQSPPRLDADDVERFWRWRQKAIEFVSPKYDGVEHAYSHLKMLTENLDTAKSFLDTNETCGLHVHIGQIDSEALPLKTLQCLAFITILYEEAIDEMHSSARQRTNYAQSNRLTFVRSQSSKLTTENKQILIGKDVKYVLNVNHIRELIFGTVTRLGLENLIGEDRNRKVNWQHIRETAVPLRTVEFRQHAGSVDPVEIIHWVTFCLALVSWAHKMARDKMCLPLIDSWNSPELERSSLFKALDLPEPTRRFYTVDARYDGENRADEPPNRTEATSLVPCKAQNQAS